MLFAASWMDLEIIMLSEVGQTEKEKYRMQQQQQQLFLFSVDCDSDLGSCSQPSHAGKAAPAKSFQSCPALCDPVDYSPPCSSVHGILQTRILE